MDWHQIPALVLAVCALVVSLKTYVENRRSRRASRLVGPAAGELRAFLYDQRDFFKGVADGLSIEEWRVLWREDLVLRDRCRDLAARIEDPELVKFLREINYRISESQITWQGQEETDLARRFQRPYWDTLMRQQGEMSVGRSLVDRALMRLNQLEAQALHWDRSGHTPAFNLETNVWRG